MGGYAKMTSNSYNGYTTDTYYYNGSVYYSKQYFTGLG